MGGGGNWGEGGGGRNLSDFFAFCLIYQKKNFYAKLTKLLMV
jgi:hypothetical protein